MNYQNQLTLISDILKNQQAEQSGTQDEFAQIQRLAQSLQQDTNIDSNTLQVLSNIQNYCTSGNCSDNAANITNWIESIDSLIVSNPVE